MVVSENSKLVVDDFWSGSVRSMVNLMLGQVRFYIQRLGGRPNPYSVRTPTALIAVRGTIFDVEVDLDRARSHEERLCDIAIRQAFRGHGRDAPLARGESFEAGEDEAAWPRAGGEQLGVGALG